MFLFALAQAIMMAVMKKLTYDDEYNFENEVKFLSWMCHRNTSSGRFINCSFISTLILSPRVKMRRCLWSTGSSWRCCSTAWLRSHLSSYWNLYIEFSPAPCSKTWIHTHMQAILKAMLAHCCIYNVCLCVGAGKRPGLWRWRWRSACSTCWEKHCLHHMELISVAMPRKPALYRTWWGR